MQTRRVTHMIILSSLLLMVATLSLWLVAPTTAQTVTPAVITNTPAATATPVISSTLVVGTQTSNTVINPCENPLQISVGAIAYLRPGTTIRYQATDSSAWMGYNTESVTVQILEGPVCNENRIWWRVDGLGLENPGWVKEFVPDIGYFVIPAAGELPQTCSADSTLAIGRPAEVYLNTRVRSEPGTDAFTLTVVGAGESVLVLDGPECADGWRWWFVQVTVLDIVYQGWMAETFYERTLLADAEDVDDDSLCGRPLPFAVGQRGFVDYGSGPPKYLRDAPGTSSTAMFSLVRNVPFIIEDGPICRGELNWWKIRVLASSDVIGWMAEGSSGIGYWMRALDPFEFGYELPLPPTALAD
jgi:hypothetical protein